MATNALDAPLRQWFEGICNDILQLTMKWKIFHLVFWKRLFGCSVMAYCSSSCPSSCQQCANNLCPHFIIKIFKWDPLLSKIVNVINARPVMVMDNARIHHTNKVTDLIENWAKVRVFFLPSYSPDWRPVEGVVISYFLLIVTIFRDCNYNYACNYMMLIV